MAKKARKKKARTEGKEKKKKRRTIVAFLKELYTEDPNISNEKALALIQKNFPKSRAQIRTVIAWKALLRDEHDMDIPVQAKTKKKAKKASKKKKRHVEEDEE